jgi:hypothetical protein
MDKSNLEHRLLRKLSDKVKEKEEVRRYQKRSPN